MPETPSRSEARVKSTKRSKACDPCKTRKIRCSGRLSLQLMGVANLVKATRPRVEAARGEICRFGHRKVPLRKNVNKALVNQLAHDLDASKPIIETATDNSLPGVKKEPVQIAQADLFIDRVLFGTQASETLNSEHRYTLKVDTFVLEEEQQLTNKPKGNGLFSGTYRLTFFSDSRLESLSTKLRNNKVNDLVRRISAIIKNRVRSPDTVSALSATPEDTSRNALLDDAAAARYISTYYERVHPLFPHLDRESFESTVSSPNLHDVLTDDPCFSCLYHSVLALGCLHDGGGSFEPGKGKAWELFSVALALVPSLDEPANPLMALQAITTAVVYSLGISCLSVEQRIITKAARMAQDLGPAVSKGPSAKAFYRVFWVLYSLEKMSSFHFGRSSVFIDANIVVPMPHIPESQFGSFNWALTFARHSRLLSRAMTTLFCPGICQKGLEYYTASIKQFQEDLEQWRLSIPEGVRPGPSCQPHLFRRPITGSSAIWINYLYYSFKLILFRSYLQLTGDQDQAGPTKNAVREDLISVSRSILEIITYVDVEPSTPLWILAGIPICALFVLFDQVINDPKHADTRSNLALLDIAGGHFSRLEFASGGSLPGSLIAEFAYIAREYVNEATSQGLELRSPYGPYQSNETKLSSTDAIGLAERPVQDLSKIPDSIASLGTSQDMASLNSALYLPVQDPWINGNDLLLGIDVMDIFNSLG
ncbi:hypothetical protein NM208_g5672 [Fusarium decemcellulare]|uniref:Uncharacterized protein n=1 Tax=Fusarium decemcellulare TaxID=57161 RepID=A0ACC1SG71_9HYPO|nr:hypothetical protein NM208_g5672 [Fusarium decemcellulare]